MAELNPTNEVTVLGAGPMGRALSVALLEAGRQVTVWNRTPAAAEPLQERGARLVTDVAEAVAANPVSLVNVVDHGAVDEILSAAGDAVSGRIIAGLTSDTPHAARVTSGLVTAAGGRYADGAILTPTSSMGSSDARILLAGPTSVLEEVEAILGPVATVIRVGQDVTMAASLDLAALDLFWTAIGGFLHGVQLARAGGISATRFLPYAQGIVTILPAILDDLTERIEADRHGEPTSSIASTRRSVTHLTTASREAGLDYAALAELRARLDEFERSGHGAEGIGRLVSTG